MSLFRAGTYMFGSAVFGMLTVSSFAKGDYGSVAGLALIMSGVGYKSVQTMRNKPEGVGDGLVAAGFAVSGVDAVAEQGHVTPIATIDFLLAGLFGIDYLCSRE